jgi:hypothetical protein
MRRGFIHESGANDVSAFGVFVRSGVAVHAKRSEETTRSGGQRMGPIGLMCPEQATPNAKRCDLRGGGFHRKNQRHAGFDWHRLANGALQYRNIRYWAADSRF